MISAYQISGRIATMRLPRMFEGVASDWFVTKIELDSPHDWGAWKVLIKNQFGTRLWKKKMIKTFEADFFDPMKDKSHKWCLQQKKRLECAHPSLSLDEVNERILGQCKVSLEHEIKYRIDIDQDLPHLIAVMEEVIEMKGLNKKFLKETNSVKRTVEYKDIKTEEPAMNRDLVHKSVSNQDRNKLDLTILAYHNHTYKEAFKVQEREREENYLSQQHKQDRTSIVPTWEIDKISRAPQTLNAECFYASVVKAGSEGIDEVEMKISIGDMNKGDTDAAHDAAYLEGLTPPIETFIKLGSLTELKKSLRCLIQVVVKEVEGEFATGQKLSSENEIGLELVNKQSWQVIESLKEGRRQPQEPKEELTMKVISTSKGIRPEEEQSNKINKDLRGLKKDNVN
ncbi:hypothetical protein PPACK8108_LOCUS21474 [Phakopsora pachyrhizi]|uniref:Uncharacterized protein n=1 Tax=Phakopsora pachyrhizi TaxID=170000 RepID=A0AAV0BHI8_PHAPC|nr:hypothetical protein PPACK8108_LOCUS21474 [Phakopsora pachyrhizi]